MNFCKPAWAVGFGRVLRFQRVQSPIPKEWCIRSCICGKTENSKVHFSPHNESFKFSVVFLRNWVFVGNGLDCSRFKKKYVKVLETPNYNFSKS